MKQALGQAGRVFSHPFVLILAGAIISSVLLPILTREWQNHERELEIKAALVEQMSETASEFVVATKTWAYHGFGGGQSDEDLNRDLSRERTTFDVQQAVIAAKLRAYFPRTTLGDEYPKTTEGRKFPKTPLVGEWNSYGQALISFFDLIHSGDPKFRKQQLANVKRYLTERGLGEHATLEALSSPDATAREYRGAFLAAEQALFAQKDVLVQKVIEGDSAL